MAPGTPVALSFADGPVAMADFAAFRAIVYLPWHMHALSFAEFVALGVPLFVPAGDLLYTVEALVHFWRQDAGVHFPGLAPRWLHNASLDVRGIQLRSHPSSSTSEATAQDLVAFQIVS